MRVCGQVRVQHVFVARGSVQNYGRWTPCTWDVSKLLAVSSDWCQTVPHGLLARYVLSRVFFVIIEEDYLFHSLTVRRLVVSRDAA